MKKVKTFTQFLYEKKIKIKSKYTDKYPAKKISSNARVRTAVFDAISDGVITADELKNILKEIGASSRWLSKNKKLFNISEDDGTTCYKLSPYASKIMKAFIIDEDVHSNPNMNTQGMGNTTFPDGETTGSGDIPFDLNDEEE